MQRNKYMTMDEVKQLRSTSEGWALRDLAAGRQRGPLVWLVVDVALSTGLRVGEISAIKVEDCKLSRDYIEVTRSKKRGERKPEALQISKDLRDHLRQWIGDRKAGSLWLGERGDLTAQGLQRIWKAAIKRAGLPSTISIHQARHTLATHLYQRTRDLRLVQKQLGHSSPTTTAQMYAEVLPEVVQTALDTLYQT